MAAFNLMLRKFDLEADNPNIIASPSKTEFIEWETQSVYRGARLLDEVYQNWWKEIDLDILTLDSATHDILGQLYGGFYKARLILNLEFDQAEFYGFDSALADKANIDDDDLSDSYKRLIFLWSNEIKERLIRCID